MLGLGENIEEVESVMQDLRQHGVSLLTLGQYLQPTKHHLPVERYLSPAEFEALAEEWLPDGLFSRGIGAHGPFLLSCRSAGEERSAQAS